MNTTFYAYKEGQFANDVNFARCETQAEADYLRDEMGWTIAAKTNVCNLMRWVNNENRAWRSGNAFGFQSVKALTDTDHSDHADYDASTIIAKDRYYKSLA